MPHSFALQIAQEAATLIAVGAFIAAIVIWAPTVHQVFMG
jgi:hypothetical protein